MAGENAKLRCHTNQMHSYRLTASGAKTKGDVDVENDIVVFYLDDAASGELVGVCYAAEKALLPIDTALVVNAGDDVYWNDTSKEVTKTTTDVAIGWGVSRDDNAGVASANGDTDCMIELHQPLKDA